MISDAAVEAAVEAHCEGTMRAALEAAYPFLLSHERQQTAGAHRDAMVNRDAVDRLEAEVARLRAHILDIDAHATPFGDIPDDPGYVGAYLISAGSLHRALGTIGHTAPSCEAEAELRRLRTGR